MKENPMIPGEGSMNHKPLIDVTFSRAVPEVLLEGPTRSVAIRIEESDIEKISVSGDDKVVLGAVVRMLCYGFIMATREHGSSWQMEKAAEHALNSREPFQVKATTIKMPDGLHESLEVIAGEIGVSVASLIRGVVITAADGRSIKT